MPKKIERVMVPYDDITIGEDFNSRKSFKHFIEAATVMDGERRVLRPRAELIKDLDEVNLEVLTKLEGLAQSLDSNSLIQPIVVREGGPARTTGKRRYFLVTGERRYWAIGMLRHGWLKEQTSSQASWTQVEAKLVKWTGKEMAEANLVENLQRDNPEPLEEAEAFSVYMEEFKVPQKTFAKQFGLSEAYVSQRLALLKKTAPEVQEALQKGTLTATQAREIQTLPPAKQREIVKDVEERVAKGEKVTTSDVHEVADKHKAALGIKQEKTRKKNGKGQDVDTEKVSAARALYEGMTLNPRSKIAVLEQIGSLHERMKRPNVSDATKAATKHFIAAFEWQLGLRETLG